MRELSLNVMDITQNSISAGATEIGISVYENEVINELTITITDNGKGMTEEQVRSVTDPFYTTRTTRPVGLGVPLFKMEAEMTGGDFEIKSTLGVGTKVIARFVTSSIDMIPLGDINATILPLVTGNSQINFIYERTYVKKNGESKSFRFETNEVLEVLGDDVPLQSPEIVLWIRDYLNENTEEILN